MQGCSFQALVAFAKFAGHRQVRERVVVSVSSIFWKASSNEIWTSPTTLDKSEPQNEAASKASGLTPPR